MTGKGKVKTLGVLLRVLRRLMKVKPDVVRVKGVVSSLSLVLGVGLS